MMRQPEQENIPEGYKATKIGVIPEDWKVQKLEELGVIKSGSTPSRAKQELYFCKNGIPWVKTLDLNNSIIHTTQESITDIAIIDSSCTVFPKNTVLVAMYGGFNQIGRTGIISQDSAVNQAISALVLYSGVVEPYYVNYYLNHNVQQWKKYAASSRKDPNITRKDVCSFLIPVPPIQEQNKIATIISTWDKAIEQTQALLNQSKQQKKYLMQQLLTGKQRLLDDGGQLFDGEWEVKKLKEIADDQDKASFVGGPFGSSLKSSDYTTFGVRVIQLQNIGDGYFINDYKIYTSEKKADELKSNNIYPGDIILSKMGDPVGRACIIPNHETRYVMCSDGIRLSVNKRLYDKYFIYAAINNIRLRNTIEKASIGSTRKRIALSDLRSLNIDIPCIKEQQKIASVLTTADQEIEQLEQQIAAYEQEKKYLMQQLLAGKTRVKVDAAA
jgi:type I restriction enzyme S subunit